MDKKYNIKKNYYLLLGLYESFDARSTLIPAKVIDQYNDIVG